MDFMLNRGDDAAAFLGILYAEDFDEPPAGASSPGASSPSASAPQPAPEPAPALLTQDDLDAACAAAVVAARREWEASEERRRTELLAATSAALAGARNDCEAIALAVAEGAVATMLAMLAGALPRFCQDHGPAEIRALLDRLLPMLRAEPRVTVRVHPELVQELKRSLSDLELEAPGEIAVRPAPIERGDVRVAWENGSMSRDTKQILQAMQDALAQLGLHQPVETSPKRIMAHAE